MWAVEKAASGRVKLQGTATCQAATRHIADIDRARLDETALVKASQALDNSRPGTAEGKAGAELIGTRIRSLDMNALASTSKREVNFGQARPSLLALPERFVPFAKGCTSIPSLAILSARTHPSPAST